MALSSAEIAALPYPGGADATAGPQASDYKKQYAVHGKAFRWWRGLLVAEGQTGPNGERQHENGRVYVEQAVPEGAKVYPFETKRSTYIEEWGLIEKGSTALSTIPGWAEFKNGDRIALLDVTLLSDQLITRAASGLTDRLAQIPVTAIISVLVNGAIVDADDYTFTETGLQWLQNAPAAGTRYNVLYRHLAVWEWRMDEEGAIQAGTDGEKLPQIGIVRLVPATGDHPFE